MATYTFSEFHFEEAELLVDLVGAQTDLADARDYVERLLNTFKDSPSEDYYVIEALCVTAIVKYGRAFVSGVRTIDKRTLTSDLPPEIQITHTNFLNWRNLHITHSVNDFEMAKLHAQYCVETVEETGITAVSVAQSRIVTPSSHELCDLLTTIDYFLARIQSVINSEERRVLEILRGLPVEQVLRMDEPVMIPGADRQRASKSRKRQ